MGTLPPAIPSSIAGIAEIAGVVHSDPNDRNDYMETRLKAAKTSMRTAVPQTKELYEQGEGAIVDISVSGDGTWRKRAYTSSISITSVLSVANVKYWTQRSCQGNANYACLIPEKRVV